MSDAKDWSPSYTAWKLMETILEGRGAEPKSLGKEQLLDLYSDCINAVAGEYISEIEDLDEEIDEDDFDEDADDEDDDDDD